MTAEEYLRLIGQKLDAMQDRSEDRHTALCERITALETSVGHQSSSLAELRAAAEAEDGRINRVELKGAGRDARETQRETTFDNWRSVAAVVISLFALIYSVWRNGGSP